MVVVLHLRADWHSHEPNMVAELHADRIANFPVQDTIQQQLADKEHGLQVILPGLDTMEPHSSEVHFVWAHSNRLVGLEPKQLLEHWPYVVDSIVNWKHS